MEQSERLAASLSEEGRYRLLVEAVVDYAIYMLDPAGIVTSWNPGAERVKGYAASEIIGQHFSRFYTEEDRAAGLPAKALETARTEGKFESENWRVRKDGSRFWAYVVIDPIRAPDGGIVGFAKVTRDLTERRDAQLVLERTREALVQSQKMDALGQLTGGIAHDFNNLLMAVLGSLELMRKRLPDDPKLLALHENAVKGAERGRALTNRMLAFARRKEAVAEAVSVPALVRGMTELIQRSLGPAYDIELRFPLVDRPVLSDANQLEMALLNLVVNARDAMYDGGRIVIALREEAVTGPDDRRLQPGSYLCLSVSDTGIGMDEETLRRAVEPFFTTKGIGKGTGLGLSMVHGIAERSGGRFMLRSRAGEGTVAELWLPAADRAALDEEARPAPQPSAPAGLVVLAVDDDPLVLTNTVAMLEDMGHAALAAESGAEALDLLRRTSGIDVVVTDQAMPHMTGLQLAAEIARHWPDLPVLLATGYMPDPDGVPLDLPVLEKPFTEADLAARLGALVPPRSERLISFAGRVRRG
ncbi:PAS domain-containing sensor histidine kinase [Ancylobacter lacus]|uniref:PAS domain-containing sensor histidine kinase n=1 Tax=Ancylobacter lacus TaxID=2579970 RepID=UPI001BD061CD|nr:PAS domain-containing sensor histidine kinase [Ancylobacter lacus]MBS7538992.1 PAS domain S-box protein [Ancylobacter lacus]